MFRGSLPVFISLSPVPRASFRYFSRIHPNAHGGGRGQRQEAAEEEEAEGGGPSEAKKTTRKTLRVLTRLTARARRLFIAVPLLLAYGTARSGDYAIGGAARKAKFRAAPSSRERREPIRANATVDRKQQRIGGRSRFPLHEASNRCSRSKQRKISPRRASRWNPSVSSCIHVTPGVVTK